MKKFMSLMLGMTLVLGLASVTFAEEPKKDDTKKEAKKKKAGKKKADKKADEHK